MNPTCWLTRRRLDAYYDGEPSPRARSRLEGHLSRCPECAGESAALGRLQAALVAAAPEVSGPIWDAFWPQVRVRLAAPPAPEAVWRRAWTEVPRPRRLVFGSAFAAAALAVLAVLAPWQGIEEHPSRAVPPVALAPTAGGAIQHVVVQSVEAADPQSSVMVYTNPEATVVWVFGLERTDI